MLLTQQDYKDFSQFCDAMRQEAACRFGVLTERAVALEVIELLPQRIAEEKRQVGELADMRPGVVADLRAACDGGDERAISASARALADMERYLKDKRARIERMEIVLEVLRERAKKPPDELTRANFDALARMMEVVVCQS